MFGRERREPVEQAFAPGKLCEQHHAGKEIIHVEALQDSGKCVGQGDEAECNKSNRA